MEADEGGRAGHHVPEVPEHADQARHAGDHRAAEAKPANPAADQRQILPEAPEHRP